MAHTPFKLLGLTQEHKDFLHRYAQSELGTSSRTKAILALIDTAMQHEHLQNQDDLDSQNSKDELRKQAIKNREHQILQHQEKIKNHTKEISQAKLQNREIANLLSKKKLSIKKKRIQFSMPIYDYEYLEKLAKNSKSSIQYYITVIIIKHLYNEQRLLGDEIEVLKKSNYELYKIGVNINQIAKANNIGNMIDLPINKLYKKIQDHLDIVQKLLNSSTSIY